MNGPRPPGLVLPDRPDWADLRLARPAGGGVVVAALVAGGLVDLAVRSGGGLAGAVMVAAAAAMLAALGGLRGVQWRALIGVASVFGCFLALRSSDWLLPFDLVAAGALLALGASLAGGGSLLDLPLVGLAARSLLACLHGLAAPAFARQGLGRLLTRFGGDRWSSGSGSAPGWGSTLRGIALALPLLLVLGALLASADALFAHLLDWIPDVDEMYEHVVLVALGAWGMAGLLRLAAATPAKPVPQRFALVGPVEASVVLGSVVALFAVFAATQVVGLAGGGRKVVETAGMTFAEYARSGFFQLVAVAAITFAVLLAVDVLAAPDHATRRRLLLLSEGCVALTLVIVVSALRRLDLYENAYGLTMLRFYSAVFVVWVGACLVLLGGWFAGHRRRAWFPAAALGAGLAGLLVLNLANPEAIVVRRNMALAERTGRFDAGYLFELSDDAIPELVRSLPRLEAATRAEVLTHVCSRPATAGGGWAAWNGSERAAVAARNSVCPSR